MDFSDSDRCCNAGSVTSKAKRKRKANNDHKSIVRKPKLARNGHAEQGTCWNSKKTYAASGAKNFLHGTIYQLKHLMLVLNRARKKRCAFNLATEMDSAEKFDDLVFEYEDSPGSRMHRFIQLKHKQNDDELISVDDLLAEDDGDFSILKYFVSWRKIKNHPAFAGSKLKFFILCTNIRLDVEKIDKKLISFTKVDEPDEFLEVNNTEKEPLRYKLVKDTQSKLYDRLKSASDLHKLAKALAKYVNDSKKMELKTDIFKCYNTALAREVLHIENGKARFMDGFINGNGLSETTKKFRGYFFTYYAQNTDSSVNEKNWQDLASKSFKVSLTFGGPGTESRDELPTAEITDKEISDFLDEFVLAVNQPNEVELGRIMKREFGNNRRFNLLNANMLVDSFQSRILEWFKSKQGVTWGNEDSDCFFNELHCVVSSMITIGVNLVYSENLRNYDIKFKREIKGVLNFLRKSKSAAKPRVQFIESEEALLTALRIYQTVRRMRKYKKEDSYIFIHLKDLLKLKKRVLDAFKSPLSNNLLVVDCGSISADEYTSALKLWKSLCEIIKDKTDKRIIVITDANGAVYINREVKHITETDSDNSIDKLETSTQKRLLNKKVVKFQGRDEKISFASLLGTDNFDHVDKELKDCGRSISGKTLVKLILGEDTIMGEKVMGWEDIKDCYISRTIDHHVVIEVNILMDPGIRDVFAIGGIDEEALTTLLASQERNRSSDNSDQPGHSHLAKCFILKNGQEESHFENLCQGRPTHNIHWLQHESGKLMLVRTHGNVGNLIKYKDRSEVRNDPRSHPAIRLTEDELAARDEKNQMVILSDTAGMGKSIVLTHLAELMRNELLVIRINLTQCTAALALEKEEPSFDSNNTSAAVDFLLTKLSICDADQCATYSVFKTIIERQRKAVLLFDGFDEISPNYTSIVVELLQALAKLRVAKLFVTTRPNVSKELEEKLVVFSHTMRPFSRNEQEIYLVALWRTELNKNQSTSSSPVAEDKLRKRAKGVLNLLAKSMARSMQEFTGVPLQTRMVAEVFPYDESKLPKKINIIDLYHKFVDKKLDILSKEKRRYDHTNPAEEENEESTRRYWLKRHEEWALDALFDEETVRTLLNYQSRVKDYELFIDKTEAQLRPGIVTSFVNNKPQFIHRTFAEYFAAKFVFAMLKKNSGNQQVRKFFVEQLFANSQYQTIRAFLNCLLAETDLTVLQTDFWKFDLIEHRIAGESAYHVIARERNVQIAKFLVGQLREDREVQFSNINCLSEEGKTPLIVAVETVDNFDVVKCFVEAGADVNFKYLNDVTPLHAAITHAGELKVVNYLIDKSAKIESQTDRGLTPLHTAVLSGRTRILNKLITRKANIEAKTNDGLTPLHFAAGYGKLPAVRNLLKQRAEVNSRDEVGQAPLHLAAENGRLKVVEYLIKQGARIDSQDEDGQTPLHPAAKYGKLSVVEHLLEKCAEVNSRDELGQTPLHLAAQNGKLTVVEHLLEQSAEVNSQDENGQTPLHLAVKYGKYFVADYLLQQNVEVDSQNKVGQTPLHLAADGGDQGLVKLLIEKCAAIESRDMNGWTPLHVAALRGKKNIQELLIEAGAKIESETVEGWTFIDIADAFQDVKKDLMKKDILLYFFASEVNRLGLLLMHKTTSNFFSLASDVKPNYISSIRKTMCGLDSSIAMATSKLQLQQKRQQLSNN